MYEPPSSDALTTTGLRVYAAIAAATLGVFAADLFTPLGIAVWVLYLVPVAIAIAAPRRAVPLQVASAATGLMFVTLFTDDTGVRWDVAVANRVFGVFTVWALAVVGFYFIASKLRVRRQEWLQSGQVGLALEMGGEQRSDQVGELVLKFLAEYADAHAGAMYVRDGAVYRLSATYAVPAGSDIPPEFKAGDGLLGQAAKDRRVIRVRDVPDGYLTVGSALGRGNPRYLLIAPAIADKVVAGVLELGFVHPPSADVVELLDRSSESIAVAVRSANYRAPPPTVTRPDPEADDRTPGPGRGTPGLERGARRAEPALKESQAQLEQQQIDLEQANARLHEQTLVLEEQKESLERSQGVLEHQARELGQASRYKSDFLANMSHELRTPLNSSLILAKLLADNPQGNLTPEQVKFASTIRAAGNDLLALINDILDLSKIEAGRMEVHPEPVTVSDVVDGLTRTFAPLAGDKGLELTTDIAAGCPAVIETDRQRLDQVLKNLLSNAVKFTADGAVTLRVGRAPRGPGGDWLAFAVSDTGIGIPDEHQRVVFDAFMQADGTTNRKYGGTGLGLSISRELARLLGGEIELDSTPGRGSTFTVVVPVSYDAAQVRTRGEAPASQLTQSPEVPAPPVRHEAHVPLPVPARGQRVPDDRDRLTPDGRTILVVEDDVTFARILYDLARELDFQCVVATTAEEGRELAAEHMPSAVILDVGLPDHSGLSVLDRLKHDARTRHIPVHVVSAGDHAQTALALGAVGYLVKPVERDTLAAALGQLETRLARQMRRVLVVEDDQVQRESLQSLLRTGEVETVGVGTAADCQNLLRETTFDCMVLDLSLPDASGFSLLETLSREDAYSFPPAIVYTGRDLSSDEEQRLRKYSQSIIIKGAKSPERLLDEVTLFLHQVVAELPAEQQRMLEKARSRDAALEGRRILVVEDDVRNVFALTSILEPRGAVVQIARNGREALAALAQSRADPNGRIDLVLMDVMMPEMDGLTATRELRTKPEFAKLPVIMLTAKAMTGDQEKCLAAGANDYMAKPLDVEKLLSLVRVWMPR